MWPCQSSSCILLSLTTNLKHFSNYFLCRGQLSVNRGITPLCQLTSSPHSTTNILFTVLAHTQHRIPHFHLTLNKTTHPTPLPIPYTQILSPCISDDMPVMSAIYCNFANPIISDAVNVPHVSVEINKRFYYYFYYY